MTTATATTNTTEKTLSVTTKTEISHKRISYLLCSAFEGGSNYWYMINRHVYPPNTVAADFQENGKMQYPDDYFHPAQLLPLVERGAVIIEDMESGKKDYRLDLPAINKGLQIFAEKYPKHFNDFITENDDANTADIFLQCCLFGDAIYS